MCAGAAIGTRLIEIFQGDGMSNSAAKQALAIVMLSQERAPSNDTLGEAIAARLPFEPIPSLDPHRMEPPIVFFVNGAMCTVMKIDKPCPLSPNEPGFAQAWYWPTAYSELKEHKAHVIASAGGDDPKASAAILGQLVAAIVEASTEAIGVNWAQSGAFFPAKSVPPSIPKGKFTPPTHFCVSVKIIPDEAQKDCEDGCVAALSQGLSSFGLREIEARGFKGDPRSLYRQFIDLAEFLIDNGPVIEDGDTVGEDEATKIRVRHEASSLIPGVEVYRLYRP
jgi:hypothetical protein